ncbi:cupin domain-containing protein, partial [Streptococcus agalactiae]
MSYIEKIEANKVLDLKQIVPIEEEQMLSKTLVQRKDLGMTVFSLDKGQEIGRHSSPGDAMVNIL